MYTKEPSETQYSFTHNSFFLKPKLDEKDIFFKIAESINEAKNPIDLSALGGFRKTIGTEGVKLIEEEIFNVLKKNKLLKGKTLIPDITVVPSNIQYPISYRY